MEQAILRNLESRLSVFGSTLRQAAKVAAESTGLNSWTETCDWKSVKRLSILVKAPTS